MSDPINAAPMPSQNKPAPRAILAGTRNPACRICGEDRGEIGWIEFGDDLEAKGFRSGAYCERCGEAAEDESDQLAAAEAR